MYSQIEFTVIFISSVAIITLTEFELTRIMCLIGFYCTFFLVKKFWDIVYV